MSAIHFDVNDDKLREKFFNQLFIDYIAYVNEDTQPIWGKMTPQHMIEHLLWTFECSTGKVELPCRTPENMLDRAKRFLHDNRPMPHDFKNPLLGENPIPLRFHNFSDAKDALQKEISCFINYFREQPSAIHVHPVFGPLGAEEWQRTHFKHCYHHLLQFRLINNDVANGT
jgi:oxepin-CoA hydrolase/3-oxo-5,6-dehydrosuberyl-CoA semialdehyde dehydrogenase